MILLQKTRQLKLHLPCFAAGVTKTGTLNHFGVIKQSAGGFATACIPRVSNYRYLQVS